MSLTFPVITIQSVFDNYSAILASHVVSKSPRVVLFLGSNLGNMTDETANTFIGGLAANLGEGDKVLLGKFLTLPEEKVF